MASLIIYSTIVIAIVSAVVSLNLKQIYRSEALVTIASDNLSGASQMSGGLSGLSSLASFAGISIDESADSKKTPSYVVAKINSLSFFRHLSSFDGILEGILAQKSFNPKTGQIIYDQNVYVVETNNGASCPCNV